MAKINCLQCDICGRYIVERDHRYKMKIRKAKDIKVWYGVPSIGYQKHDICEECGTELETKVMLAIRNKKAE